MKKWVAVLPIMLSQVCFAGLRQNITVCANVEANISPKTFTVGFVSSDVLDFYHRTSPISFSQSCITHQYGYGPKNIKLQAEVKSESSFSVILDESCSFFYTKANGFYESIYFRREAENQLWMIELTSLTPDDTHFYRYQMKCSMT